MHGVAGAPSPEISRRLPAPAVLALSFAAGSVPFSQLAARLTRGVDLRTVDNGTVSGTALYRVAGFGPLAVAGVCDVAKGAVGPVLAGPERPVLGALGGAAAVAGHNWSPWLRGAGGRGLSPAMGALLPRHPEGAALLLGGVAVGWQLKETGLGSFLADVALIPFLTSRRGRSGAVAGAGLLVPMFAKRLLGNGPPPRRTARTYLHRLLYDNDGDTGPPR